MADKLIFVFTPASPPRHDAVCVPFLNLSKTADDPDKPFKLMVRGPDGGFGVILLSPQELEAVANEALSELHSG